MLGGRVSNLAVDHLTLIATARGASQGIQFAGRIDNLTVSNTLIEGTAEAIRIGDSPVPQRGMTFYRNVMVNNSGSQPLVQFLVSPAEIVNNIAFDWLDEGGVGGLGLNVDPALHEQRVNVLSNIYGNGSTGDGAVVLLDQEGEWFFDANLLPSAETQAVSTSARHVVPEWARVRETPTGELAESLLPCVGARYRTSGDNQALAPVAEGLGGAPNVECEGR